MRAFLAFLAMAMIPTSSWAADPGVTDTEVVIGGHTVESGKGAINANMARAASVYFDSINAKGGIHGRKIKYIRMDTEGEYVKAVAASKKLVEEDNIFAAFLNVGPTHKATYKYFLEHGVPDLFFTDGLQEYVKPFKHSMVTGQMLHVTEARELSKIALSRFKGKKVCFLVTDDQMGEEYFASAKQTIGDGNKSLGDAEKVKMGVLEKADRFSPQVNTQILNMKRNGCEVVQIATFGNLTPTAINYATSQGFMPTWMVYSYNVGPKFVSLVPAKVRDGIIALTQFAVDDSFGVPGWNPFIKALEAQNVPIHRAQTGYAAAELFTEALKRAGKNLTRDSLIKAMESMNGYQCSLCLAPITIGPKTHEIYLKPTPIITKGGQWVRY